MKKILKAIVLLACIVLMVKACNLEYKSEIIESIPEDALSYIGANHPELLNDADSLAEFWAHNSDSVLNEINMYNEWEESRND